MSIPSDLLRCHQVNSASEGNALGFRSPTQEKNNKFLVLLGLYNNLRTSGRQSEGTKNELIRRSTTQLKALSHRNRPRL